MYVPAALEPLSEHRLELYVNEKDELHLVLSREEENIQLETNIKLDLDVETLPTPDRITIGQGVIGCIGNIVWMGDTLAYQAESNLLSLGFTYHEYFQINTNFEVFCESSRSEI